MDCKVLPSSLPFGNLYRHIDSVVNRHAVVQTLDSAIHRIKIYPMDGAIGLANTIYPLDSDLSSG